MGTTQDEADRATYKNNILWYLLVAVLSIILFMLLQKLVHDNWSFGYRLPSCHNATYRFAN
jgi:hypothetical protein